MLIILTGRSCSGKDTVKKELLKKNKNLIGIKTYTTRTKRPKEKDGVDYHFISDEEFREMIENNEFAEYKEYTVASGDVWLYGCRSTDIEKAEDEDYIIILTPQGVRDLKKNFPHIPMKVFYIYSNLNTIKDRSSKRPDNSGDIKRRIEKDKEDFKNWENEVDKIVYNNLDTNIDDVSKKILGYLYD